jgi:monoamine oxidase
MLAQGARRTGLPSAEYVERSRFLRTCSRRSLLQLGAGVTAALSFPAPACVPRHPRASGGPTIAIIGAGVAGLTAAYRLAQVGLHAQVFDSWNRVGGRILTARQLGSEAQLTELGGELIDTDHVALCALARELGLTLDAILEGPGSGIRQDTWFFGGRNVSDVELVEAFRPVAARLARDVAREEDAIEFARIDQLGLAAYLDGIPELSPLLRQVLEVAYVAEYGRELEEQSPWNLLRLIDSAEPAPFRVYGASDEALHVRGGNDQITTRLAGRLSSPGSVELEHTLVSVVEKAGGAFRLSFDRVARGTHEADFDRVIFALPFTRLRQVSIQAALPPAKRQLIAELGMGSNAKLMAQFTERVWRTRHASSGSVFTDNGLSLLWEGTRGQSGTQGMLTLFTGGRRGEQMGAGTAESQVRARLGQIDQIFPGAAAAYVPGSALRMHWPTLPHTLGSYTCYLPGQARFSGLEGVRVGGLHFCGEHTSQDFQGFMNGGVESGERVAREVLEDLGIGMRPGPAVRSPASAGG